MQRVGHILIRESDALLVVVRVELLTLAREFEVFFRAGRVVLTLSVLNSRPLLRPLTKTKTPPFNSDASSSLDSDLSRSNAAEKSAKSAGRWRSRRGKRLFCLLLEEKLRRIPDEENR